MRRAAGTAGCLHERLAVDEGRLRRVLRGRLGELPCLPRRRALRRDRAVRSRLREVAVRATSRRGFRERASGLFVCDGPALVLGLTRRGRSRRQTRSPLPALESADEPAHHCRSMTTLSKWASHSPSAAVVGCLQTGVSYRRRRLRRRRGRPHEFVSTLQSRLVEHRVDAQRRRLHVRSNRCLRERCLLRRVLRRRSLHRRGQCRHCEPLSALRYRDVHQRVDSVR